MTIPLTNFNVDESGLYSVPWELVADHRLTIIFSKIQRPKHNLANFKVMIAGYVGSDGKLLLLKDRAEGTWRKLTSAGRFSLDSNFFGYSSLEFNKAFREDTNSVVTEEPGGIFQFSLDAHGDMTDIAMAKVNVRTIFTKEELAKQWARELLA